MNQFYPAALTVPKRALQVGMAFIVAFGVHATARAIDTNSAKKDTTMTPTLIQGSQGQLNTYCLGAGNAGLPIIFVHADPGRATQWKAVMTGLAKKHDVVAFDSRGSGASAPPVNGDYSYEGRATDIGIVAEAYQLKRFVIVSHSAGAAVALQYAALNADRVAGLLMVDPATDPRAMPAEVRDGFIKSMTGPDSAKAFTAYVESIAGSDPKVRKQVIADAKKLNAKGRADVAKATGDWNPEITLKAYKGPMFILSTPATDNAGALYRLVSTIPHEVVSTKGHWIQLDHPDVVQKAIETFLVEVAAKTTAK
jgi:pimeloyl-ACP methyl ester carboxylesterase